MKVPHRRRIPFAYHLVCPTGHLVNCYECRYLPSLVKRIVSLASARCIDARSTAFCHPFAAVSMYRMQVSPRGMPKLKAYASASTIEVAHHSAINYSTAEMSVISTSTISRTAGAHHYICASASAAAFTNCLKAGLSSPSSRFELRRSQDRKDSVRHIR